MKKNILAVLVTLMVAGIACGLFIIKDSIAHEKELDSAIFELQSEIDELNRKLEEKTDDCVEISNEMDELCEQVYNMKNGDPYKVEIEHGNEIHIWESDMKGLFPNHSHTVMTIY